MARRRIDLGEGDIALLASALGTSSEALQAELERRPKYLDDVLSHPDVCESVLHGTDAMSLTVSPKLLFAVLVHRVADELASSDWVNEWVSPGCRLPVFDVEPLVEFADAPGRLEFTARLLAGFTIPQTGPVASEQMGMDDLVDWLDAVDIAQRVQLLRQLGDMALFQAGVFPDRNGPTLLSTSQAEHLGRSVGMTDDELDHLVDPASPTPGLDALETLSSAWYTAAAEASPSSPVLLHDVAHRIRAARRFLNYLADHYLHPASTHWPLSA
jgi:hypothetical protein